MGFGIFLVHPPMALVLLSASVERCFVSRMRDFFFLIYPITSPELKLLIRSDIKGGKMQRLAKYVYHSAKFWEGPKIAVLDVRFTLQCAVCSAQCAVCSVHYAVSFFCVQCSVKCEM